MQSVVLFVLVGIALVGAQRTLDDSEGETCFTNEECTAEKTCVEQQCVDLCINACGLNTVCQVVSHTPECSCKPGYVAGYDLDVRTGPLENFTDCVPPRCDTNSECPSQLSCIDQKCVDPCANLCSQNKVCEVFNHNAICSCKYGFVQGDDLETFGDCVPIRCTSNSECPVEFSCIDEKCTNPCPDACGLNTACDVINHDVTCTCNPGFSGDPLQECKVYTEGECTDNTNCPDDKMCANFNCQDPCSDVNGGENTVCSVHNHLPIFSCKTGYSGSPATGCKKTSDEESGKSVDKVKKFHVETGVKADWHGAFLHCQNQGKRLASIETAEENTQVLALIEQSKIKYSNFWTAGTDRDKEGHWVWYTTGKPITGFTHWQKGQPDNLLTIEDCMGYMQFRLLTFILKSGYWWNDFNCNRRGYFICEYYE